ncbi:hypothetical protein KQX54_011663 [Cotesia glomerata]|uniref:Uncharacterized protein n=1 Tax=Cotesia glomerata TaxID=32391 RepID=A0AAV7IB25_COTGL|nr:hypothetical protein KQX54_011663 [Cotesia glomerata]
MFAFIFWPNEKKTSIIHSTLINKRLEFNCAIVSWGRKFLFAVIIAENDNIDWLESLVVNTNGIITGSEQSCLKKNTCFRTASENMLSNTDICAGKDVVADANCDTHFNFSVGDDGSSNVVAEDDVCPSIGVDASSDAGADVGADIKVDDVDASAIANIIGGANIIADIETENEAGAGSNVGTDIGVEDVGAGADVGANIEVEYNVGALADVSTKADVVADIRAEDDIGADTSAGAGAVIVADIGAEDDFDADVEAKDVVGAEADVGANAGVEDDAVLVLEMVLVVLLVLMLVLVLLQKLILISVLVLELLVLLRYPEISKQAKRNHSTVIEEFIGRREIKADDS